MYLKNTAVLVQPGRKGARSNLCILRVSLIGGRYSVAVCMPDRRGTGSDRWKMEVVGWWLVWFMRGRKFQARRVRQYGTVQTVVTGNHNYTVSYVPYCTVSGL